MWTTTDLNFAEHHNIMYTPDKRERVAQYERMRVELEKAASLVGQSRAIKHKMKHKTTERLKT